MKAAVMRWIYGLVMGDAELLSIVRDVPNNLLSIQLFMTQADPNTLFPYFVFDLNEDSTADDLYPNYEGRLTFSVWDRNRSRLRAISAAQRLKGLMENRYQDKVVAADGQTVMARAVRIRYYGRQPVPTGREDVLREDLFFSIRLWDQRVTRDVATRT